MEGDPPRAGPGHTGGITFPVLLCKAWNKPCSLHPTTHPSPKHPNIVGRVEESLSSNGRLGFPVCLHVPEKKENMENYKNLRNIGYDMSLTLSCGAVSFLPPNFCLWFLVPWYPESYNQEKQVVLVFGSYPPRKGAPSASIVKTQAGNFKHGEDGEMTPLLKDWSLSAHSGPLTRSVKSQRRLDE